MANIIDNTYAQTISTSMQRRKNHNNSSSSVPSLNRHHNLPLKQNNDNNQNLMSTTAIQQNIIDDTIPRDIFIQPPDLFDNTNYSTTFKPLSSSRYQYQISKSYLV